MWYSPIGFIITLVLGLVVSYFGRLVLKERRRHLDPDLFFPIVGKRLRRHREIDNGDSASDKNIADGDSLKKYSFKKNKKTFFPDKNSETVTHV